jgi:single-strand DNA-binding protein
MSRGLSKIILIGNLGKDPEMKYTQQGTAVTSFSLAVGRVTKGQDGQQRDETDWYRVSAWRKLAEFTNEYLRKGSRVYVEGRLSTREWQTTEGQNRTSLEVDATEVIMLDTKAQSEALGRTGGFGDERPSGGGGGGRQSSSRFDDEGDMDPDDIPF